MSEDKRIKHENDSPIINAKDATATAVAVGGAAGSALLVPSGAPTSTLAIAAVLVTLLPPVLAMMTEAGVRRMKARGDHFFQTIIDEWAQDESKTYEEVAGLLEESRDDPNVSDAVWRAVRGLMEAPSDAAAIPLGVLTAEYVRDKRSADSFFRGTVRLLAELSQEEITELHKIVEWVLVSTRRSYVTVLASDVEERTDGESRRVPWFIKIRRDDPNAPNEPDYGRDAWTRYASPPDNTGRLIMLLKANGLGGEPSVGILGAGLLVELERAHTERLARVLRTA